MRRPSFTTLKWDAAAGINHTGKLSWMVMVFSSLKSIKKKTSNKKKHLKHSFFFKFSALDLLQEKRNTFLTAKWRLS